jgi:predicted short-subunit dehydrogenase-like oxidoreductase (DUF2520 family)
MTKLERKVAKKLSVSVIGAGRLGTSLALALVSGDYTLDAIVTRRPRRARQVAAMFTSRPLALSGSQFNELPASDLILITTPDDLIAATAVRLAASQNKPKRGRTVLHTSGALSSEVLAPLAAVGFQVGSLHPLISVSDPVSGVANLRDGYYCLEGDRGALRVARAVVRSLGGRSFPLDARRKALYHAAAVTASGHVVALFDIAAEMLMKCGLSRPAARRVLLPLVESTVKNLVSSDPEQALTGTFARGDLATVQSHLKALRTSGFPDALDAYKLLGRRSLILAQDNGIPRAVRREIERALAAETEQGIDQ